MDAVKNNLEQKIWALSAYKKASQVMMRAKTPQELIEGVCQGITHQPPFVVAWVGLKENNPEKSIVIAGVSGMSKAYADGIQVSWDNDLSLGQGPTGRCVRTAKPVLIEDVTLDQNFLPWLERAKKYNIRASIAVPVSDGKDVLGALMVYASVPNAFGHDEVSLFESLANEVGFALSSLNKTELFEAELQKRLDAEQKIQKNLELTVAALSNTLESRDPYTAGHQERVANIAVAIATALGWDEELIYGLKEAGLLHDIGKISVPVELLTKPTHLSSLEKALINEHAENGYQILKEIPFSTPVALAVRQHHERLDGSGYPMGLKGDQIIPLARVLAVADTIEAMSTHRPYRLALGLDKAMDLIKSDSGTKLDAEVVSAAERLYKSGVLQVLVDESAK